MNINFLPVAFILTCLMMEGCSSTPWEKIDRTTPLGSDGQSLIYKRRFVSNLSDIGATSPRSESIWEESDGNQLKPDDVIRSVEKYFLKTGQTETFRTSHSWIGAQNQLVPEYRICIITVDPTIVLMIPHDFGELSGRSTLGIKGDLDQWGDFEFTPLLLDGIFTGSDFPYTEGVKWFSPNIRAQPKILEESLNQKFIIEMKDEMFEIIVENGRLYVNRSNKNDP